MELLIAGIIIILVLAWGIYHAYHFFTFKAKLMNSFGKIGISYGQANNIYALYANQINALYDYGRTHDQIAVAILNAIDVPLIL